MPQPRVIAVSGASGCGKTTLVTQLAAHFHSDYLCFDDFVTAKTYPEDMLLWFNAGADVSQIETPNFAPAIDVAVNRAKGNYVFIEEPFGRSRPEMKAIVDEVILLDTPLAICLSRVIQRHLANMDNPSSSIGSYLNKYQRCLYEIYRSKVIEVKMDCDLVVDATTEFETLTMIVNWLMTNNRKANSQTN